MWPFRWRRQDPAKRINDLVLAADSLRDAGNASEAAEAYARILPHIPGNSAIQVQYANMLKDCGRFSEAESAYELARKLRPKDPDVLLQFGHLLKLTGRRAEANRAYLMAYELNPRLDNGRLELLQIGEMTIEESRQRETSDGDHLLDLARFARSIDRLQAELTTLQNKLPDWSALNAFPIECWENLRRSFDIPEAPGLTGHKQPVHIVIDYSVANEAELHAQLVALFVSADMAFSATIIATASQARTLVRYTQADTRLKSASSLHEAMNAVTGLVVLCTNGDRLHPRALNWFRHAFEIAGAEGSSCDSETLRRAGDIDEPISATLRSPADYDSLLEADLIGGTIAVRAEAIAAVISRDPTMSTTEAIRELALDLSRSFRLAHVPLPLVASLQESVMPPDKYRALVARHLTRYHGSDLGIQQRTGHSAVAQVFWPVPDPAQLIVVIIPTRVCGADLSDMILSLREKASQPRRYEVVVVDNGCDDPEGKALLQELQDHKRARVLRMEGPFNWAFLNNRAADVAMGDILVFANDDMRVLSQGWDDVVRSHLARSTVGAVGAKLLYPHGAIQHAGILTGWRGSVIHDGLDVAENDFGPNFRYAVTRRVAAVTGAFLCIRRKDFEMLGGFDTIRYAVSYNDVDLCFRLRSRGYSILWTPDIVLSHHESMTLQSAHGALDRQVKQASERRQIAAQWKEVLELDETVNPHWLSFGRPLRLLRPPSKERILAFIANTGRGVDPYCISPRKGK